MYCPFSQDHVPLLVGCVIVPSALNRVSFGPNWPEAQLDQVPAMLRQEWPNDVSRAFAAGRLGWGTVRSLSAASPPDMDLSCLPMVPPTLPACARAEDTFAKTKCDRASKAIPADARRLILPPRNLVRGIVPAKRGYWKGSMMSARGQKRPIGSPARARTKPISESTSIARNRATRRAVAEETRHPSGSHQGWHSPEPDIGRSPKDSCSAPGSGHSFHNRLLSEGPLCAMSRRSQGGRMS